MRKELADVATRRWKGPLAAALALVGAASGPALAGGILLYEVGTADVGLASAGYAARAQDASTVLTNPAGMTRLAGNQVTLGAQALYADLDFTIGSGTTAALGAGNGGNPIGWFPGGGAFYSHSLSPDLKLGIGLTGNFGSAVKYDADWVGRYHLQEGKLIGASILPSVAWRVQEHLSLGASLVAMYGMLDSKVAVNNLVGADGQLAVDDNTWGFGARLGALYELGPGSRIGLTYNSQIKLDFRSPAEFSGVGPLLTALLRARGLLDANVDLGVTVPQGVHASVYHEIDRRWAVLGSVGWQDWSKFGLVDIGVDSNNPVSLTTDLGFKDTWHAAVGVQHRLNGAWTLNFGVAYDSKFQENGNIALALPANSAWRFGVGAQNAVSKTFEWGVAAEYVWQGDLGVNKQTLGVPVALGGRGNVVGSFDDAQSFFIAVNANWRF